MNASQIQFCWAMTGNPIIWFYTMILVNNSSGKGKSFMTKPCIWYTLNHVNVKEKANLAVLWHPLRWGSCSPVILLKPPLHPLSVYLALDLFFRWLVCLCLPLGGAGGPWLLQLHLHQSLTAEAFSSRWEQLRTRHLLQCVRMFVLSRCIRQLVSFLTIISFRVNYLLLASFLLRLSFLSLNKF